MRINTISYTKKDLSNTKSSQMLVYTFFARQFSCEFTHFLAYKFQGHKMRWSTIFFINIRYSKPGSVSPLPELGLNCKSKLMGEWNTLIDLLQQLYKIFPCCCYANSISESNLDLILTTHILSWKIFRPWWPLCSVEAKHVFESQAL